MAAVAGRVVGAREYTNDEPLKTNFRFIDTPPTTTKKKPKQNKTKQQGAVSPKRLILQLLTKSGL